MTAPATEPELNEEIYLCCTAPRARTVCLVGDFNQWNPSSHPMERRLDGSWWTRINLKSGRHHYLFLVDGQAQLDLNAMCVNDAGRKERVSFIAIS